MGLESQQHVLGSFHFSIAPTIKNGMIIFRAVFPRQKGTLMGFLNAPVFTSSNYKIPENIVATG